MMRGRNLHRHTSLQSPMKLTCLVIPMTTISPHIVTSSTTRKNEINKHTKSDLHLTSNGMGTLPVGCIENVDVLIIVATEQFCCVGV